MVFLAYSLLPFFFAVFIIIPIVGISLALAFYKVNRRPFLVLLEAYFKYLVGDKLYVWKKIDKKITRKEEVVGSSELFVPRLSDSKLKDISWSLDVEKSIYAEQENDRAKNNNQ